MSRMFTSVGFSASGHTWRPVAVSIQSLDMGGPIVGLEQHALKEHLDLALARVAGTLALRALTRRHPEALTVTASDHAAPVVDTHARQITFACLFGDLAIEMQRYKICTKGFHYVLLSYSDLRIYDAIA